MSHVGGIQVGLSLVSLAAFALGGGYKFAKFGMRLRADVVGCTEMEKNGHRRRLLKEAQGRWKVGVG